MFDAMYKVYYIIHNINFFFLPEVHMCSVMQKCDIYCKTPCM